MITGQMSIYGNEMTNALFTKKKKDINNNSNIEHLVCDTVLKTFNMDIKVFITTWGKHYCYCYFTD